MAPTRQSAAHLVRLSWPGGRSEKARLLTIGKSGGAGEVYAIEDQPGYVAKLYHDTIRGAQLTQYARKIRWMIDNKPALPTIPTQYTGIVQLAWPVALVMKDARFAGFVMEKIDFERTMELDYLLTRRQAAAEGFDVDFGKLVAICCNLASLIHCLHSKRIAVVDLKPINLKVYKTELYVSILDCDGFHITAEDFASDAPQVTPEYLAPEFHDKAVTHPQAQDWFALATIVFRLLNFGIHPYAGIPATRQPYPPELAGRIKLGLYPYSRVPDARVRAAPASVHECLPDNIRELFDRSFGAGLHRRASAQEWARVLATYATRSDAAMTWCAHGHLQFAGKNCPTCLREGILRGHLERRQRFIARLQTSPARALTYVKRTLKGTQLSPFQAALAQIQLNSLQLAPVTLSMRNVVAVEILWTLGLLITYWWLR